MGDIKALSVEDLARLMGMAARRNWSALGRPEWFGQERANISQLMLVVLEVEHPSVYRGIVTAILKDRSGCRFTLDVEASEFRRLPDIDLKLLVTLAHRYLGGFPLLKLDRDQEETWGPLEGRE
jgi:hypothetical protein